MNHENIKKNIFKSIFIGILSGTIFCVILMIIGSFLIVKSGRISPDYINPIVTAFTALSAIAAGFTAGKILGKNGLLIGALCGIGLFFIILLGSLTVTRGSLTLSTLIKLITLIAAGAIGGIWGVNKT